MRASDSILKNLSGNNKYQQESSNSYPDSNRVKELAHLIDLLVRI